MSLPPAQIVDIFCCNPNVSKSNRIKELLAERPILDVLKTDLPVGAGLDPLTDPLNTCKKTRATIALLAFLKPFYRSSLVQP